MSIRYTDAEINEMLEERKHLPLEYKTKMKLRIKRGHKERELDVKGELGNSYRIILRQLNSNPLAFSVILAFSPEDTTALFRLRRYNGRNHDHTNQIENNTFTGFHIHTATERYQELRMREDTYAELTDRYSELNSALKCLFEDCGFIVPDEKQNLLFGDFE